MSTGPSAGEKSTEANLKKQQLTPVYVSNLPHNINTKQVSKLFEGYRYVIHSIELSADSPGSAIVFFTKFDLANIAIFDKNGEELDGKKIKVSDCKPNLESEKEEQTLYLVTMTNISSEDWPAYKLIAVAKKFIEKTAPNLLIKSVSFPVDINGAHLGRVHLEMNSETADGFCAFANGKAFGSNVPSVVTKQSTTSRSDDYTIKISNIPTNQTKKDVVDFLRKTIPKAGAIQTIEFCQDPNLEKMPFLGYCYISLSKSHVATFDADFLIRTDNPWKVQLKVDSLFSAKYEEKIQEAFSTFKEANSGDKLAQFRLGLKFLEGDGVQKDTKKATEWLQKSADQGNFQALFCLGKLQEKGKYTTDLGDWANKVGNIEPGFIERIQTILEDL